MQLAGHSARNLVRSVGLALAPHGDDRMDYTAAYFYGSLLIELSFTQEGDIFNKLAQPPLPRPSNLWLLNRPPSSVEPSFDIPIKSSLAESLAALANDDMSNGDENVLSILGNDFGMEDLLGGFSDTALQSRIWPATSDQASSMAAQLPTTSSHDIFSGSQGNIDKDLFGTDVDWPWLCQPGDGHGPAL